MPLAGVASVAKCPDARLALGGGFFANPAEPAPPFRIVEDAATLRMIGQRIIAEINKATGHIRFIDGSGHVRIAETGDPAPIAGVATSRRQGFAIGADERLYGLGQFREPVADYRDADLFLAHANSDVVNPFLVSAAGWGLLWDTGTAAHFHARGRSLGYHSVSGDLVRYHVCLGRTIAIERCASDHASAAFPAWPGACDSGFG